MKHQTPTRDEAVLPSVQDQAAALRTHLTAIPMIEWVWDDAKMIFALLDRASAPAPASGRVDAVAELDAFYQGWLSRWRDQLASLSPAES